MGYIEVDPALVDTELSNELSETEFLDFFTCALRFNRSRDPLDFPAKYDKYLWGIRFVRGSKRRKWHNRSEIWERFAGVCHICGSDVPLDNFHIEHVVPLARGGADDETNINIAHPECNFRKGTQLLEEVA